MHLPLLYFLLFIAAHPHAVKADPFDWFRKFSSSSSSDMSWLWGWTWIVDGTISVVDRTPPITFPARPASFGAELTDPLLGYVIPLSSFTAPCAINTTAPARAPELPDPVQGCPGLCVSGPHAPDPNERWIALVQRGGCPFVEKASQAQRLGARAVVVGGDAANPDALLNMYSERGSADITIAATYIKYWDYVALSDLISSSNTSHSGLRTVSLLMNTEYSAWEWPIVTFSIILLLPSVLTFATLLIHRIRVARQAQRDRAPEDFVHSLPWRVWTGTGWEKHKATRARPAQLPADADADVERDAEHVESPPSSSHEPEHEPEVPAWVERQVECAICLEVFAKGDRVRVLPCNHMFHMDEVDEWLIHKKKLCPICKADVTRPHLPSDAAAPAPGHPHPHLHSHLEAPSTEADNARPPLPTPEDSLSAHSVPQRSPWQRQAPPAPSHPAVPVPAPSELTPLLQHPSPSTPSPSSPSPSPHADWS